MSLHNFFTLHNICAMTSTTVIKSYRIGPYMCVLNKYDIIFMGLHLRNGRLKIVGFVFIKWSDL